MAKIKIAFCGCGGIAQFHLSHLVEFDDVEFVGFYDILPEHAEEKARYAGAGKVYGGLEQMLDQAKPDALYICVPPAEHGAIEDAAIARGIPFLVEKPMALSMELAERILAKIEAKGLITAVGFQDRYLDIVEKSQEFLAGRQIGLIEGAWVGGIPGVDWWPKYATSGGQIVEQNIHLFDLLRYLIGEPKSVYCAGGRGIVRRDNYDVHDYSSATVTFQNGVVATLFTGCYLQGGVPDFPNGLTFHCADATVAYRLRSSVSLLQAEGTVQVNRRADQGVTEDRTFVDAVKTGDGSAIRSPYRDAVQSLRLTLACNESMASGCVISL